ncbi:MAG TPA: ABC transporter substrate-binding protein [Acidobacteriota bacterium]|nr:ABC transporter substrate-binding protein [Acidobacteriota bacterium]
MSKNKFAALIALVILKLVGQAQSTTKDINFGWPSGEGWSSQPYKVAQEKGFFEREGLRVRMITFRGTNLMLAALMSGDLDYMTILPFTAGAAARGVPVKIVGSVTKSSTQAIIARPEIDSIKQLKGKKIGINSFGSSVDYTAFAALSRSGLDPQKDVNIIMAGGGNVDRILALTSGSIDATVVSSPFEFHAEKQGLKTIVSAKELGELVRIPVTGINVTHKKIEKDGDEIVRLLRALRAALLTLQEQQSYGIGLFEKAMRLDRPGAERLYGLVRDQYNPELTLPDAGVNDLLAVGTFRSKEKTAINLQTVRDWSFAEKAKH